MIYSLTILKLHQQCSRIILNNNKCFQMTGSGKRTCYFCMYLFGDHARNSLVKAPTKTIDLGVNTNGTPKGISL